jgi:SAM-dependent methyltransferase
LTHVYGAGHRLVGIDVDPEAIARARDRGIDARAHDLNGPALPFDDHSFDVVIAGEVLEHLQFPSAVVTELRRVLRPDGILLGSVPNAFRLRNRLTFLLGRPFEVDPTHLHQFSPDMIRDLLSAFSEVDLEFHGGRRSRLHPRLMATQLYFRAQR